MPARKSATASAPKRPKTSACSATAKAVFTPPAARRTKRQPKGSPQGIAAKTDAVTTITTRIDVGLGNQLYIRGDGPGLNWDRGVPAVNAAPDLWTLEVRAAERPFAFKCLLNDHAWSRGDDFVASPGSNVVVAPTFR
ncbi:MAG: hypothetical protein ACR2OZ_01570 [Verrucomicrobiales bacterium]